MLGDIYSRLIKSQGWSEGRDTQRDQKGIETLVEDENRWRKMTRLSANFAHRVEQVRIVCVLNGRSYLIIKKTFCWA